MIWKRLYDNASFLDSGTLYHLRNVIHRTNVSDTPKSSFHACEEFFVHAVVAHILAAALKVLGMKELHQAPETYQLPDNLASLEPEQRRLLLQTIANDILSKFLAIGLNSGTYVRMYILQVHKYACPQY